MGVFIFLGWIGLCVLFFTQNMNDDKTIVMKLWDHILIGISFSLLTSLFGIGGYAIASLSMSAIKRNKEITIYLYLKKIVYLTK